jgi:phosphopantetheine adenylyltransferase
MNQLTKFLVDGILNEDEKQVIALFGGGFKPPTKGHLDVIVNGIRQNPEISRVKIIVGGGERNGFTQDQSAKIWEIYRGANLIPIEVDIVKASPFKYYKDYLTKNPNDKVFVFIGSRPENDGDQFDVKERSEYVKKYSDNVIPVEVATSGGVSGTEARDLFKNNIKSFRNMFPDNLSDDEYEQILTVLGSKVEPKEKPSKPTTLSPIKEEIVGEKIECDNCDWSWNIIDGGNDLFMCHECGHDNTPQLENIDPKAQKKHKGKSAPFGSAYELVNEADPKKGTGKKPKKSGRRLYTDEDPKDTVGIKFSTKQDIVDTLNKTSFKAKSHARQSQIINLIHQRVRAAYGRTKDPVKKKRLKTGLDYITKKKEASKKKNTKIKKGKTK